MNLIVRELPREHRAARVLRQHVVPRWGVEVVKVEGTNLSCAFTSVGRTFAALVSTELK
jgi:hypothetical protein